MSRRSTGVVDVAVVVKALGITSVSRGVGVEGSVGCVRVRVPGAAPQQLPGWRRDGRGDEDEIHVESTLGAVHEPA